MGWHDKFEKLFTAYRDNYVRIFNLLYPAKNSTGFTERNLSVNFAKAYEAMHPSAITWYEFQFGENNDLHYDAIIIDPVEKEILLIESKRFNKKSKINEVKKDIHRINKIGSSAPADKEEFSGRIDNLSEYTIYGVILADVWVKEKSTTKRKIWEAFQNQTFLDVYCTDLSPEDKERLTDRVCFARDFADVAYSKSIQNKYRVLALVWKLT